MVECNWKFTDSEKCRGFDAEQYETAWWEL